MRTEIYKIYEKTNDFITDNNIISPLEIIEMASDLYVKYKDKLPSDVKKICSECKSYIDKDFENEISLNQYIEYGNELIENISGTFGAFLEN